MASDDPSADDAAAPVQPALTPYSDWPYKVRSFPARLLSSLGLLAGLAPRADLPERVE